MLCGTVGVTQDSTHPGADCRTSVGEIGDTTKPRLFCSENGGEGAEACGRFIESFPNVDLLTAEQSIFENRSGYVVYFATYGVVVLQVQ